MMPFVVAFALTLVHQVPQDTTRRPEQPPAAAPVAIAPIVVTATRSPLDPAKSPLPAALLGREAVRRDLRTSLAEVTSAVAGVRAQTTGQIIGKPVIRGLGGARVLTLDGGHRLEDYSWSDEDGPSMDPRLAERIEVIRGPASLLYGSDAIGGVINAVPEPLPQAAGEETLRRLHGELFAATNNPGAGAGLEGEWARGPWSARLSGVAHLAGNTQTPACELENTGYSSLSGEAALGVRGRAGHATLRVARFGGEFKLLEAGGPGARIPAGCPGGPPRPPNEEQGGPERRVEDYRVQLDGETAWRGLRLEARGQFQSHTTSELSEDITPGTETETIHLGLATGTLDLLVHHRLGAVEGTVGFSGLLQSNRTGGLLPLVPDATTGGAAAFAVERVPAGRLSLLVGLRGDVRRLTAEANSTLGTTGQTRDATAWTGDVGLTFEVTRGLVFAANAGRAFRAPSLFELFSDGPRLGEARYEVGDAGLVPEVSRNLDFGLRWSGRRVRGEAALYHNRIAHFIYVTPTGTIRVVGNDSLREYRYVQSRATLRGGEATLALDPTDRLSAYVRAEVVRGDNDSTGTPLPLMPPARVVAGFEWHTPAAHSRRYAGVELEGVARQRRLAPFDIPTAGYVLLGLMGGTPVRALGRALSLGVRVRNALDVRYRNYLNRYKEFALDAGRSLQLRIGTEF